MIEAYRIGVELVLGGDLAAGIEALIPSLTRLDGSLSQANAQAKALAAALGGVAATAPGIGQAAVAVERLTSAMALMNRATADRPAVTVPPENGGAGTRAPQGVGKRPVKVADAPVAAMDPGTGMRSASAGIDSRDAAPVKTVAAQVSAAQSLVQVVQPMTPLPSASRRVEVSAAVAPAPPGSAPRVVPAVLPVATPQGAAPVGPGAGRSPSAAAKPLAVVVHAAATPTQPALEPVQPTPTRAAPGVAPELPRAVAKPDFVRPSVKQQITQIRDVVLPRLGNGPVDVRALDAMPQAGKERAAPVAATVVAASAPAPVRPADESAPRLAPRASVAPAVTQPSQVWPGFAASLAAARRAPATQALASPPEPQPTVTRFPLPKWLSEGPPDVVARKPSPSAKPAEPAVRTAVAPAAQAGLPDAPSFHPRGNQGGPLIQHVTYVQLDERTIARAVTRQQLRMMGGQVSGTLRPDPSIAPQYGAHLLEL